MTAFNFNICLYDSNLIFQSVKQLCSPLKEGWKPKIHLVTTIQILAGTGLFYQERWDKNLCTHTVQTMEKYELVKTVGEGSFGKALLCTRKADRKQCIIKQIAITKLGKKEVYFTEQEVSLLARLRHPNIVTFWESFKTKGFVFIVMEFADGGDLDKKIKARKGKRFTEGEVLHLFVQITLAMKHVHDRKILHRDLKTQAGSILFLVL